MSEHALQVAVAHMLQVVLDPERTWFSAIDHGAGKLSKRSAGMMKARGVKRGLPDIIILTDNIVPLGIELKTDKGKLTPEQREVGNAWIKLHAGVVHVARSLEEVQEILEFCGVPMLRRMNFLGGGYGRPGRAARPRHPRAQRPRKSKIAVSVLQQRPAEKA
jgi:hypothetical protein